MQERALHAANHVRALETHLVEVQEQLSQVRASHDGLKQHCAQLERAAMVKDAMGDLHAADYAHAVRALDQAAVVAKTATHMLWSISHELDLAQPLMASGERSGGESIVGLTAAAIDSLLPSLQANAAIGPCAPGVSVPMTSQPHVTGMMHAAASATGGVLDQTSAGTISAEALATCEALLGILGNLVSRAPGRIYLIRSEQARTEGTGGPDGGVLGRTIALLQALTSLELGPWAEHVYRMMSLALVFLYNCSLGSDGSLQLAGHTERILAVLFSVLHRSELPSDVRSKAMHLLFSTQEFERFAHIRHDRRWTALLQRQAHDAAEPSLAQTAGALLMALDTCPPSPPRTIIGASRLPAAPAAASRRH